MRQYQLFCTESVDSQYIVSILHLNFLHTYCRFDRFRTKTYKYLKFEPEFLLVRVKTPLKQHLDHHLTRKLFTGSVDSVFNPSMFLRTAGGRENLRTDRELRPSLGEIGKAT